MADLASLPTSIQSVYTWYREDRLYVNRRYQRKLVWTLEEKQKLIESIIKRYPIPAILIAEKEDKTTKYEIIDGLQRLHAMMSFIEGAFFTLDGKSFDLTAFPTAKSYADREVFTPVANESFLAQKDVLTILDYSLAISVMRNATEAEVNDVFDRINTYGHRLSDQERRQAGIQNEFSTLIRNLACKLRGDGTADVLPLFAMPSISIDLPKTKHGYDVKADEIFWVTQGILRATDLRDSMDEQCIADITACIVSGELIERSKDALDAIYKEGTTECDRILSALEVYGSTKFSDEFKHCVDAILDVCRAGRSEKLRDVVFKKRTTNPFPSVFAVLLITFHELIVKQGLQVANHSSVKTALSDLSERIGTSRGATSPDERRKNIDTVKGLIISGFVKAKSSGTLIYGNHTTVDVEEVIRRSEIELGCYELKQGMLPLSNKATPDENLLEKILKTICGIANIGPSSVGKIIIGVTDKAEDAVKIQQLDGVEPRRIARRSVVGVNREAVRLGISVERYVAKWKETIRRSTLSPTLRDSVLSNMDYNSFYGLGILVITIPSQNELSYLGDEVFWREADSTKRAETPKQIAALAKRF